MLARLGATPTGQHVCGVNGAKRLRSTPPFGSRYIWHDMQRPRHVASLDEVRITREPDGETAFIEYADDTIGGTHLKLGPALHTMTDAEVLERFNDMIAAMEELRQDYRHVAIEVPIGQPQIEWSDLADQWCARGHVLRCVIHDGGGDDGREPLIEIDGKQLTWAEFGQMLTTFAGWGMRLVIVPDDETHQKPTIRVRDPAKVKQKQRRRARRRQRRWRP